MIGFDALTLDCFIAVCDTGSFTRAADKVGRTQSAISQQIAKLELQLEKTLFIRGKSFALTAEGEILLRYARSIMQLQHEAVDRFKQPELKGEVRFGLPEDFASVFLSDVLSEFAAMHPRILLNIECDLTVNLFQRFKEKAFDLVLVKMNKPSDFPNGIDVWSEQLEWVGSEHFFSRSTNEVIPLILSPQPCVYRLRAINALEQAKRKWRMVFCSDSFAGKIAAVKAGLGITVLPRNMIPSEMRMMHKAQHIPTLADTHVSMLKHGNANIAVNSFEQFVMEKLLA